MLSFNQNDADDGEREREDQQDDKIDRGLATIILVALPIIIFPFFTGDEQLLIGVSMSTAVNRVAIAKCWELKMHVWFWIVILFIMAFNISTATLVHWPRITMTRLILLPMGVAYYVLTIGIVRLVERILMKTSA